MKPINKDELFQNLSDFLKTRGIELKEGSYAHGVRTSCGLLTDAINLGQQGLEQAKAQMDKHLEQMRQVIHEKTAPKPPPATSAAPPPAASSAPPPPKAAASKPRPRKARKPSKKR
jgi:hypothetical protein